MDAEEAGDLLDRVSLADSLHGEMSSALQFSGRTRGSHATEDSDPKAGCSIIFLTASSGGRDCSSRRSGSRSLLTLRWLYPRVGVGDHAGNLKNRRRITCCA